MNTHRTRSAAEYNAYASDAAKPVPNWLLAITVILYLAVLVAMCWLAEVDVLIAHAWHWLGGKLA